MKEKYPAFYSISKYRNMGKVYEAMAKVHFSKEYIRMLIVVH
jgi:hypothetical protein